MVKVHRHCPTILSANLLQRRIEVAAHGGCFCNKNPYRLLKSRLGQPVITNEGLWCVARRLSSIDVNGDLQSYPSHAIHLRLVIVESHHFYKKIDRLEKSRPRNTIQNLNGDTAPDCSA